MSQASVTWIDGMQFVVESGSGHALVVDADAAAGGHDCGPRPMELILMGVLGCTAMDVIKILEKKRRPLLGLKVFATGEQVPEAPRRFDEIHLEYVAYGDIDEQTLGQVIDLSEEKYCSVMATLRGTVTFSRSIRIEPAPLGSAAVHEAQVAPTAA